MGGERESEEEVGSCLVVFLRCLDVNRRWIISRKPNFEDMVDRFNTLMDLFHTSGNLRYAAFCCLAVARFVVLCHRSWCSILSLHSCVARYSKDVRRLFKMSTEKPWDTQIAAMSSTLLKSNAVRLTNPLLKNTLERLLSAI